LRTLTDSEKKALLAAIQKAEKELANDDLQKFKGAHALSCEPCRIADQCALKDLQLAREILLDSQVDHERVQTHLSQGRALYAGTCPEAKVRKARQEAYDKYFKPHVEMSRHSFHPEVLKAMGAKRNLGEDGLRDAIDQAQRHRDMQDEAVHKAMTVGGHPISNLDAAQKEAAKKKTQEIFDEAARRYGARR
jgi:hypothetical protein